MLVHQTNLYANRDTNNLDFKVDYDSICKFIGIILFSGYHHVPTINDYRSQSEDLAVPFVANQMSRSRFKDIKKSSSSSSSARYKCIILRHTGWSSMAAGRSWTLIPVSLDMILGYRIIPKISPPENKPPRN